MMPPAPGTCDRRALLAGLAVSLTPLPASSTEARSAADVVDIPASAIRDRLAPSDAEPADLWVFDGSLPGPVIRIRHGDELRLRLTNDTPHPLSLHWQGVRGPNAMDGVGGLTQAPVAPAGTFEYRLTPPDSGTFLGRPIILGASSEPAGRGLCALLIVEEREPPKVDAEYALVIRDWLVQPSGGLAPFGDPKVAALAGRLGNRMTVAAEPAPKRATHPPGARIRLRLANACNARIMRLRFDHLKVFVAAVDGQPTEAFEPLQDSLPFPPGTRYDLLADLPAEAGATSAIVGLVGNGVPLLEIATGGAAAASRGPIAALPANPLLPPEIKLQAARRADLVIAGGATRGASGEPAYPTDRQAIWTVNGRPGSTTGTPVLSAKRGQPVVLGIANRTGFPQPMHLHGHVCRLLHALDDGWEPYWLDTFQVPEGKTVHIAFMADNPGRWLIGSTVLERLDTGLWSWFEVT